MASPLSNLQRIRGIYQLQNLSLDLNEAYQVSEALIVVRYVSVIASDSRGER